MPTTSNPILDSLLSSLDDKASQFLMEYGRKRRFQPGELVAREGEPCTHVYIILNGAANIIKDDAHHNANIIAQVRKGAIIGEMGVFMDLKRSATIRAEEDLIALELKNEDFVTALLNFPALTVRLLRSLSNKVSDINHRLVNTLHTNHMLYLGIRIADELYERSGTVNSDATAGGKDRTPLRLNLDPIARESGLSRLDLTNALIHFNSSGVIEELHFKQGDRVEFLCHRSQLRDFLHNAAMQSAK